MIKYFFSKALDKVVIYCYFMGIITLMACSTACHTLLCHSEKIMALSCRLDYAGITVHIAGNIIPVAYFGFYFQASHQIFYLLATLLLGLGCLCLQTRAKMETEEFRALRITVFILFSLFSGVPTLHFLILNGPESVGQLSLYYMKVMMIMYLTGAFFYTTRVPERLFPGKFDIWFQSHQIFHFLVVVGAYYHYLCITEMAKHQINLSCEIQNVIDIL